MPTFSAVAFAVPTTRWLSAQLEAGKLLSLEFSPFRTKPFRYIQRPAYQSQLWSWLHATCDPDRR